MHLVKNMARSCRRQSYDLTSSPSGQQICQHRDDSRMLSCEDDHRSFTLIITSVTFRRTIQTQPEFQRHFTNLVGLKLWLWFMCDASSLTISLALSKHKHRIMRASQVPSRKECQSKSLAILHEQCPCAIAQNSLALSIFIYMTLPVESRHAPFLAPTIE